MVDSAHPATYSSMILYETPRERVLSDERTRFKRKFSHSRMRIEQTIGRLKNHFAYLKEIPNKGNLSQDQLKEIYIWIALVVILHNLLQTEDP